MAIFIMALSARSVSCSGMSILIAETTSTSAKTRSTGRNLCTTATPTPIMTARSASAVRIPHLRTRWVYCSGTLK